MLLAIKDKRLIFLVLLHDFFIKPQDLMRFSV